MACCCCSYGVTGVTPGRGYVRIPAVASASYINQVCADTRKSRMVTVVWRDPTRPSFLPSMLQPLPSLPPLPPPPPPIRNDVSLYVVGGGGGRMYRWYDHNNGRDVSCT